MKKIFIVSLLFLSIFILSSCRDEIYTLTFMDDDENVVETIKTKSVKNIEFPVLTKENFEFAGWVTENDVLIDTEYHLNDNITLYPKWLDIIVSFHKLDGEIFDMNFSSQTYILPFPHPGEQEGIFVGYFDENDVRFDENFILTTSVAVYPKFLPFKEHIRGSDFGDDFFGVDGFLGDYYYATNQLEDEFGNLIVNPEAISPYEPFEDYLISIGGPENFTEEKFIMFFAQDLIANNPTYYMDIKTKTKTLIGDINNTNFEEIKYFGIYGFYIDDDNVFYREVPQINNGDLSYLYIEVDILTNELNESNFYTNKNELTSIRKYGNIVEQNGKFYMDYNISDQKYYVNLLTGEIENIFGVFLNHRIKGKLFRDGQNLYEYIEPITIVNGDYIQFESTPFIDLFRESIYKTFTSNLNTFYADSFYRLLNLVLMEIYPELYISLHDSGVSYHLSMRDMFVEVETYSLGDAHLTLLFNELLTKRYD